MRLVTAMDSPWFQMYADMANVAAEGFDPCVELALCAGRLAAVHVKDGRPKVVRQAVSRQGRSCQTASTNASRSSSGTGWRSVGNPSAWPSGTAKRLADRRRGLVRRAASVVMRPT